MLKQIVTYIDSDGNERKEERHFSMKKKPEECDEAIDVIIEHLVELHRHPDIYGSGMVNIIHALENFAIPAMGKDICKDVVLEKAISGREFYACPNCREFLGWRHGYFGGDIHEPGRCPYCGQSLNWRV